MSTLIFYTNPMSRGQIARWMLEEVGAPFFFAPLREPLPASSATKKSPGRSLCRGRYFYMQFPFSRANPESSAGTGTC